MINACMEQCSVYVNVNIAHYNTALLHYSAVVHGCHISLCEIRYYNKESYCVLKYTEVIPYKSHERGCSHDKGISCNWSNHTCWSKQHFCSGMCGFCMCSFKLHICHCKKCFFWHSTKNWTSAQFVFSFCRITTLHALPDILSLYLQWMGEWELITTISWQTLPLPPL